MILVDTDVMVDVLRRHQAAILWLASLGDEEIAVPGFVAMELIQGCRNKSEQTTIQRELEPYELAWPSPSVCEQALSVFAAYHLSHNLGFLDALIGQLAVSLNAPLVTFNQKHYAAIPNLKTIQPYVKGRR